MDAYVTSFWVQVLLLGFLLWVDPLIAVQIAKALGAAHVYATGSAVDLIKGLGADTVINYKEQDVVAAMTGLELDIVFARLRSDHGRRRRHRHGVHDAPHQGQARPHRVQAVGRRRSPSGLRPLVLPPVKDIPSGQ